MIKYILRYRKLKRQLEKITNDTWDGRLYADQWEEWPLMRQAMEAMERKIDMHSLGILKNKQAEYLALQNQINPHFLYNILEAIRGDALCEGAQGIANTTKALATFFRYMITEVAYEVTLEDELNNIENYFTIQQYRFGDKLQMKIELPQESLLQTPIPKLTLQPLVENAISHGLEEKIGQASLKIVVDHSEHFLFISIKDNGVGITEEKLRKLNNRFCRVEESEGRERFENGSIALVNVNSRIRLLYGVDYGLHIYSVPGLGTEVKVTLPLLKKDPNKESDEEGFI